MISIPPFAVVGIREKLHPDSDLIPIVMPPVPVGVHGAGWHYCTQATLKALHKHLTRNEAIPPNPTVLDLGSGTGIITVAAFKLGASKASKVYLSETHAPSIKFSLQVLLANNCVDNAFFLDPEDYQNWPDDIDLTIANLGPKGWSMREHSPAVMDSFCVAIDGIGMEMNCPPQATHRAIISPLGTGNGYGGLGRSVESIRQDQSRDMSDEEASVHLLSYLLDIDPDQVQAEGSDLYIGRSIETKRKHIQEVMDIQFGTGRIKVHE